MRKNIFFLFFLFLVFLTLFYFINFQLKLFEEPKKIEINETYLKIINISSYNNEDLQFIKNMKFNHNEITYYIDINCKNREKLRIKEALNIIEKEVKEIKFIENNEEENSDISIYCNELKIPLQSKEYFIIGEGGPTSIINTGLFHVIEKGIVVLYENKDYCNYPNIELHELLHVFGFKHSENEKSIMYNISSCDQVLTSDIINELKRLYSIKNLPELYFEDIEVKKHSAYIDFNLKIKNAGLIKAENVSLVIINYPSYEKISSFILDEIDYGNGKIVEVENLKIPIRSKKLIFEIILNGEEIDKSNNKIEIELK